MLVPPRLASDPALLRLLGLCTLASALSHARCDAGGGTSTAPVLPTPEGVEADSTSSPLSAAWPSSGMRPACMACRTAVAVAAGVADESLSEGKLAVDARLLRNLLLRRRSDVDSRELMVGESESSPPSPSLPLREMLLRNC